MVKQLKRIHVKLLHKGQISWYTANPVYVEQANAKKVNGGTVEAIAERDPRRSGQY